MKKRTFCLFMLLLIANSSFSAEIIPCGNESYRSYDDIKQRMQFIKNNSNLYATLMSAGTITTEGGRSIQGIVITSPTGASNKAKILITGAIHANEWIGTEVAIGLAEYLIANKTNTTPVDFYPFGSSVVSDPKNMNIKALLENVKVIIIPVLNPDGYVYSMTNYQPECLDFKINAVPSSCYDESTGGIYLVWRKNRRDLSEIVPGASAYGVDINRNFDMNYQASAPSDVDWIEYAGNSSMSEKENLAVEALFNSNRFTATIDFHSNALKVLYPYGIDADIASNAQELRPNSNTTDLYLFKKIGEKMALNVGFSLGLDEDGYPTVDTTMYGDEHATGVARDWAYAKYDSAAFNIELAKPHQPPQGLISFICKEKIYGPLWLMFWAADQGFRSKPKLQLGNN